MQPDDDFARKVISQTVTAARQTVADRPNRLAALVEIVARRNAAIDKANLADPHPHQCQAGCFSCCHQLVVVEPGEVILLALHLTHARNPEDLAALKARAARVAAIPATHADRLKTSTPCPLLEDGRCGVYAGRPGVCRQTFSASRLNCIDALAAGDAGTKGPEPWFAPAGIYAALLQTGLDHVLIAEWGVNTDKVELAKALNIALADPAGTAAAWLAGQDPFRAAEPAHSPGPNRERVRKVFKRLKIT